MEWRTIPGYPAYEISESGTVRKADSKYPLGKSGRRYGLWDGRQRRFFYPFELVGMAFGPREGEAAAMPMEAQPPAATGGETGTQPWSPELRSGPVSIPVPAMPDDGMCAALERENRGLRALVAELEAELQVYRVAI